MTNNNLTEEELNGLAEEMQLCANRCRHQGLEGNAREYDQIICALRELQQRRKADELSIQTAPALYSLSKTGEVRCSNYPVIPDGYCIMPVTLTAENGAKRALSGEFSIPRSVTCPECGGDGCSDCDGRGDWNEDQIIDWPTIKLIYQKAVEACAIAATQKQDKSA
ncbi:hypothetical protein F3H50_13050 [Escherichia coli]|uniref:hypothetical protein n=1 Tax=Escherichia coli TaxID=562 RepID=UPI0015DEBCEF|nr:hypothetical protein [Escherichia coli]DAJ95755.1 MAG TPA: DnaJ-like protein [Caudoviricetes sp.]EFE7939936.1 hypothetical protein [Escherichia coli]EFG4205791.1 hypothetical protein [Escherichia coli]ELH3079365.1 hypothetical protein [Escherichia coli]MDA6763996.1 hypothetical protein [Escherichia coli]